MKVEKKYTADVGPGKKFNENGTFNWFPGNTIICDFSKNNQVLDEIKHIQNEYQQLDYAHKFSFMPLRSIHMTVFEGLCHFKRDKDSWSSLINQAESIERTDQWIGNQLKGVEFPDLIKMKLKGVGLNTIEYEPFDDITRRRLQKFRNDVSSRTGIRSDDHDHDHYQFHVTFGYVLIQLTEEEKNHLKNLALKLNVRMKQNLNVIQNDQVMFTVFEDMTWFEPYKKGARQNLIQKLKNQEGLKT